MNNFALIRQFYKPVQPTTKFWLDDVTYTEFCPAKELQDYIFCYWQLKTSYKLSEPFTYRVVPDGCIDIFFELSKPHETFIMGLCKSYEEFSLPESFNYIGIRFFPSIFPHIYDIDASYLYGRFLDLKPVAPAISDFIAGNICAVLPINEIKTRLDDYFSPILTKKKTVPDKRFFEALINIITKSGSVAVESDLTTGLCPRHLRRYFQYYIGDTAKVFSKVIRFQHILNAKPSQQSLRKNKLFFNAGYYDQAHFIKEFKSLSGLTPSQIFTH